MNLKVVIVEDEPLGRERLRGFLEKEASIQIVAECQTGNEAVDAIRRLTPDLVFLDIRMPGLDGFGVIEALGRELPVIIFVTAHDQFARQAFEVEAADYLLKPFDRERFQTALARGRQRVRQKRPEGSGPKSRGDSEKPEEELLDRITIKTNGRLLLVKTAEIDWIGSAHNYVELHVGKAAYLLRTTITRLEAKLSRKQFIQVSRSLLVNLDRIAEIRSRQHGDYLVVLKDQTKLNGSRNFREGLERLSSRGGER